MGKDNKHLLLGDQVGEGPHGFVNKHVTDTQSERFLCFTKETPHQLFRTCFYIEDALAWCGQVIGRKVDKGDAGFITKMHHTLYGVKHLDANYLCYTNDEQPRLFFIARKLYEARAHCRCKSPVEKSNAATKN